MVLLWLGNDYCFVSVYEWGNCYVQWLENDFNGNIFVLVEVENIFCKIIMCCINMVYLLKLVVVLFIYSGEFFVCFGEMLYKVFLGKEVLLL